MPRRESSVKSEPAASRTVLGQPEFRCANAIATQHFRRCVRKRTLVLAASMSVAAAGILVAQNFKRLKEVLIGFEEVPSISTVAGGNFEARINDAETEIEYELSYSDLEGNVTQAHIHLGQRGANGGITVFLCTNLGNGPVGTQACPPSPATIRGTITASDVSPPIPATAGARGQGLDTGEFAELLRAIRAGKTYVNVHSSKFPGGEARSQLGKDDGREDDDR